MFESFKTPAGLLARTEELQDYFELSDGYVGAMRPKGTKRKKATKQLRVRGEIFLFDIWRYQNEVNSLGIFLAFRYSWSSDISLVLPE